MCDRGRGREGGEEDRKEGNERGREGEEGEIGVKGKTCNCAKPTHLLPGRHLQKKKKKERHHYATWIRSEGPTLEARIQSIRQQLWARGEKTAT